MGRAAGVDCIESIQSLNEQFKPFTGKWLILNWGGLAGLPIVHPYPPRRTRQCHGILIVYANVHMDHASRHAHARTRSNVLVLFIIYPETRAREDTKQCQDIIYNIPRDTRARTRIIVHITHTRARKGNTLNLFRHVNYC